jgi:hypothetical protein
MSDFCHFCAMVSRFFPDVSHPATNILILRITSRLRAFVHFLTLGSFYRILKKELTKKTLLLHAKGLQLCLQKLF